MKTPEEIKKGLKRCIYADCSLCLSSFHCDLEAEALEYIQQLERERDEARNDLDTLNYANTELHSAYEAMKRERDAAVEDLTIIANNTGSCIMCKHRIHPGYVCDRFEREENCYEWRGVQEVE